MAPHTLLLKLALLGQFFFTVMAQVTFSVDVATGVTSESATLSRFLTGGGANGGFDLRLNSPVDDFNLHDAYGLEEFALYGIMGGCYPGYSSGKDCDDLIRDQFINASDPSSGVDTSTYLVPLLRKLVDHGVRPYFHLCVPIALSKSGTVGYFNCADTAPSDFDAYRQYYVDVVGQLVTAFGLAEVRTWRWSVYAEFNGWPWFRGTPQEFARLYDYSLCALEDVLGVGEAIIGTHVATQPDPNFSLGEWTQNMTDLLTHLTTGIDYCRGVGQSKFDFLGISTYSSKPGTTDVEYLGRELRAIRSLVDSFGFTDVPFSVDEGRLYKGSDLLGLASGAVHQPWQAAFDARLWQHMVATKCTLGFMVWAVNSWFFQADEPQPGGYSGAFDTTSTNGAFLINRLEGAIELKGVTASGTAVNPNSNLKATLALRTDGSGATLSAFTLNLNEVTFDPATTNQEQVTLEFCDSLGGLITPNATAYGCTWFVSNKHAYAHGTYDAARLNNSFSQPLAGYFSRDSDLVLHKDAYSRDPGFDAWFNKNLPDFWEAAIVRPEPAFTVDESNGCWTVPLTMPENSVALTELWHTGPPAGGCPSFSSRFRSWAPPSAQPTSAQTSVPTASPTVTGTFNTEGEATTPDALTTREVTRTTDPLSTDGEPTPTEESNTIEEVTTSNDGVAPADKGGRWHLAAIAIGASCVAVAL